MLTENQCRQIIDYAIAWGEKLSSKKKPLEIEVTISGSNVATSRFANNEMTQNQAPDASVLAVRVLQNGRQARLTSLDLSEAGIEQLVRSAIHACTLLEEEPELLPLPAKEKKTKHLPLDRYDRHTAKLSAADRARQVNKIIALAEASNVSSAGIFSSGENFEAIGNSNKLFRYYCETSAECSITITAAGATSWVKSQSPKILEVDASMLAERAIARALLARNPADLPPGKYTAILEPAAVLDLLSYLWWDFSGTSHVDKLSALLGKVGEKVFADNITIADDVGNASQCGSPFDGEGLTRQSLNLVDKGLIRALVHSRQSARRLAEQAGSEGQAELVERVKPGDLSHTPASTGHSLPQPSAMGEMPLNIIIDGGISSVEEMMQQVQGGEQAVLLTRVWYVREVDPASKLLTGMTRDGTFLIRNGVIEKSVKNLRFNVSLFDLLNHVLALGPAVRTAGAEGYPPSVVPAMMVSGFNFTEGTSF